MNTPADNLHIKDKHVSSVPRPKALSVVLTHIKTKPELWPLFFLMGSVGSGILFMAFWSFRKLEVVVNQRKPDPLSWERARDVAYNHRWRLGDVVTGRKTGERIPELDRLQDEMLQVKREREAKLAAEQHHRGHGTHH